MRRGLLFFAAAVLLALNTQAADIPYADPDFGCTTPEQAQKYSTDFSIDTASFGGVELCNGNSDSKKLFNDLHIIEQGRFDSSATNVFIRGNIPIDQYYIWMKGETHGMDRGNDLPYATAYNRGGYFTMQDGWSKLSTLGRVGTVIHEARHTAGFRHYPCSHGPYMGARLDGCDVDFSQAGSHAIEIEYYARVSVAGQNFHPVYKAMARLMAMGRSNFVFNNSPIKKREAVLALDSSNNPVLYDGTQRWQREGNNFRGRLKRTSFGAALFNGLHAMAFDLYEVTGYRPTIKDDYSYFKLLALGGVGQLKDFEEFDMNQKRYVAVVTSADEVATYNFPQGKWNASRKLPVSVNRTATVLPTGEQGYFFIDNNSDVYSLNAETQQVTSMGKKWDAQMQSVALLDGRTLVLKTDGSIYSKNADGTETRFDDGKFNQMVNVPLYDAFEVK